MVSLLIYSLSTKHLNQKSDSQSNRKPSCPQRRDISVDFRGYKVEASNGAWLPMTILFNVARPSRVRASTITAIANFHGLAPGGSRNDRDFHCLVHGGSRPFNDREAGSQCTFTKYWWNPECYSFSAG